MILQKSEILQTVKDKAEHKMRNRLCLYVMQQLRERFSDNKFDLATGDLWQKVHHYPVYLGRSMNFPPRKRAA